MAMAAMATTAAMTARKAVTQSRNKNLAKFRFADSPLLRDAGTQTMLKWPEEKFDDFELECCEISFGIGFRVIMAAVGRFDRSRGRSIESIGLVGSVIS